MKALTTKWHARIDYLLAFTLICSPWLFYFRNAGAQTYVPLFCGALMLFYNLLTKYDISLVKLIGLRFHFALDVLSGGLLALSPWMFGFMDTVYVPHLALGLMIIGTAFSALPVRINAPSLPRSYANHYYSGWMGHWE